MYSVVIAGIPNVGKSTLFNRLINKKRAITDPTSGVTRDVITEHCYFADREVLLSDTGGIKDENGDFDKLVSQKSLDMISKADVVLFTVDGRTLTSGDESLAEILRKYSDKVILVVNKIDDVAHDNLVWNYYNLGFPRVCAISSSHGRGIGELEDAVVSLLDEKDLIEGAAEQAEKQDADTARTINISVMGKPNTGKSTLLNALTGKQLSIVSDVAGTTRDTIKGQFEYKNYIFNIIDTAGLRRKTKVEDDVEYYSTNRAIKTIDEVDLVVLMIDAIDGVSEQDKKIANLVVRRGKGIILCLNKADKITVKNQEVAITDRTRFLFPHLSYAPLIFTSAMNKTGLDKLLNAIVQVKTEMSHHITTATFNAAIKKWNETYTPARDGKRYFKVLYGTQVEENPVRFLLFVNKKSGFPEGYLSFLRNKIRSEFGFSHIPITINLRERTRTIDDNKSGVKQSGRRKEH